MTQHPIVGISGALLSFALISVASALSVVTPASPGSLVMQVQDDAAVALAVGASAATVSLGPNATRAEVDLRSWAVPGVTSVAAVVGTCTLCTPERLEADDGNEVQVTSVGILTQDATLEVTIDDPGEPWHPSEGPLSLRLRARASAALTVEWQVYNHTLAQWEIRASPALSTLESQVVVTNTRGDHWRGPDGVVQVRLKGPSQALAYDLFVDLLAANHTVVGAAATWSDVLRVQQAADEPDMVHVRALDAGRSADCAWVRGAVALGDTRLLLYANGTIEENGTALQALGEGVMSPLHIEAERTDQNTCTWTVDLVAATGSWTVRHVLVLTFT